MLFSCIIESFDEVIVIILLLMRSVNVISNSTHSIASSEYSSLAFRTFLISVTADEKDKNFNQEKSKSLKDRRT